MDLPGYNWATKNGYILHSYSSDKSSATYKHISVPIFLRIKKDNLAEISFVNGLLYITTNEFSFPHKRFTLFESAILNLYMLVTEQEERD